MEYGSIEAYYLSQLGIILNKIGDKANKLRYKNKKLQKQIDTAYSLGYDAGYFDGSAQDITLKALSLLIDDPVNWGPSELETDNDN